MFVALVIQHEMHMRRIAICDLSGSTFFFPPLYSYWTQNVCFRFLYEHFFLTFLILTKIKYTQKYPLFFSDFEKNFNFLERFSQDTQ